MNPADFYQLVCHDRRRAARHLLAYDGPGLWRFATDCAQHLVERFDIPVPADHVLGAWQRVGLVDEGHVGAALAMRERAVGR